MRKIREVLRLGLALGLSLRQVGRSVSLGHGTVGDYLLRAKVAGLQWEQVQAMDDDALEGKLYPAPAARSPEAKLLPEWSQVHRELRRKGVTLSLLWQEYRERQPEGYGYSRFCELYRAFAGSLEVSLRQEYKAGERLFVDYAGQTIEIRDREGGPSREAQIFVAALGASHLTYAEATWSQGLEDWVGAHVRCFAFLGGVPELVTPDNLKSGVTRPCWYEPELNATYAEMAQHYGVAVLPARVVKPRDKAKVESAVLQVERWILARLRDRTFFSLGELNEAIRTLVEELNARPLKVLRVSRRELFETIEREALRPLPTTPYELGRWKLVRVGVDYHVEFDGHYYSVPYQLIREQLDLRATETTVEVFHRARRVAFHRRSAERGRHTTLREHMPRAHQAYLEWTPVRLVAWAQKTGPATAELVEAILRSRPHPQQGFRSCLGLLRLGDRYSPVRLETACQRALAIGAHSYQSVKSILGSGLDQQPLHREPESPVVEHENVRGARYYAGATGEEGRPC
jgi:transposase